MDEIVLPHPSDYCKLSVYIEFLTEFKTDFQENIVSSLRRLSPVLTIEDEVPPRSISINICHDIIESQLAWSDFQAFRKIHGLIAIGFSSDVLSEKQICDSYAELVIKAKRFNILDSRCALFVDRTSKNYSNITCTGEISTSLTNDEVLNILKYDVLNINEFGLKQFLNEIRDFLIGIFWVLESKRVNLCAFDPSADYFSLPLAPEEDKLLIGLDKNSR